MNFFNGLMLYVLLSASAFASMNSAIVTLSGGGVVAPATNASVSLNGVVPMTRYTVVCYIDTVYPFQYVMLSSNLLDNSSSIYFYSINGQYVTQDQLIAGQNRVIVEGKFGNPASDTLVFTNLDQTNPFNVNSCFAIPVQVA